MEISNLPELESRHISSEAPHGIHLVDYNAGMFKNSKWGHIELISSQYSDSKMISITPDMVGDAVSDK